MKKEKFLESLQDVLQRDEECKESDILETYPEWDSLSKMALMAFFDQNFHIRLTIADFDNITTVKQLMDLAGNKIDAV